MKLSLKRLEEPGADEGRPRWPAYLFGGRVRTSTVVLIVALLTVWWVYDTYRPAPTPKPSAPQMVPPGYMPDPDYTWVPRTRVEPPTTSRSPTPTPTTTARPPITTTPPPPFTSPKLPCLLPPQFCPPSTTPTTPAPGPPGGPSPEQPQPGPGPAPTSAPPAS